MILIGHWSLSIAQSACPRFSLELISPPSCQLIPGSVVAHDIDSGGAICGLHFGCSGPSRPFIWSASGGLSLYTMPAATPAGGAFGMNDARDLVGAMCGGDCFIHRPFLIHDSTIIELPFPPGADNCPALAINNMNPPMIVGFAQDGATGNPPLTALLWRDGRLIPLILPLGPSAAAADVNDLGQITGWMGPADFSGHAFIWNEGAVTDLGVIPNGVSSEGRGINGKGEVCGSGWLESLFVPGAPRHAFLWRDGAMNDLGTMPDVLHSDALDLNDAGTVVGSSTNEVGVGPGVIWENGQIYNLNTLIPRGTGLNIVQATAINNAGQITGYGRKNNAYHAFVLTPIPPVVGDVDCNQVVNVDDLLGVITHWAHTSGNADLNGDGIVNVADLIMVLENWS